ncbi:MAG: alpha/beta hydrolase, partial [Myxococcales bacterium]|nr:alpha/beta hydrolase [Myxococcales bacterium]
SPRSCGRSVATRGLLLGSGRGVGNSGKGSAVRFGAPRVPSGWAVEADEQLEQVGQAGVVVRVQKSRLRHPSGLVVTRKHVPCVAGPPVVLIHGFAQNRYTWHGSTRSMSAWLAGEGYDVYVLELRGHGRSRESAAPERFSDYVLDAVALAEAIPEPAFWLGHSLGGAVIFAGSAWVPMRGIVGIAPVYRFAQANRFLKWIARFSHLTGTRGMLGGVNVRTRLAGQLLGRLYEVSDVAGYAFPISGWAPGSFEPELLAERLERGFDWTSLHVWLDMARWAHEDEVEYAAAWGRSTVPLLVVSGDLDHLTPPADCQLAFEGSGAADRTLLALEPWNTGRHWGHLDLISGTHAPEHVWRPVSAWLGAH